ncbi:hypothetical protein ABN349_01030 [Providencia rettgeri]|uniref:hypothetical protein n=1 Tax=Providencia rettgeri TaxID=587 RepID=UPI0032D9B49F
MKVFEKKIYIGSIIGVIATVIGVVAVFFPSVFNMEKEKFITYQSIIEDKSSANKFEEFLKNRIEDKKLFKLDVSICQQTNITSTERTDSLEMVELLKSNYQLSLFDYQEGYPIMIGSGYLSEFSTGYLPIIFIDMTKKEIIEDVKPLFTYFNFPDSEVVSYDGIRSGTNRECGGGGIDIKGYFLFEKDEIYRSMISDTISYDFSAISEKDVKLRDY